MAIRVRSTDGSNSDNGSSWAQSKLDVAGAAGADVAGDEIFLSQVHNETTASSIVLAWAGTGAAPTKIICANDASETPTASATTAVVKVTGSNVSIQHSGNVYCYGVNWINDGASNSTIWCHQAVRERQLWESCTFQLTNVSGVGSFFISAASTTGGEIIWKNCQARFPGGASAGLQINGDQFRWEGGAIMSGSGTPAALFTMGTNRQNKVVISGVDLSNLGTTFNFLAAGNAGVVIGRNLKLPSGWTGDLHSGTMTLGARVELYNCDSGDTNYRVRIKDYLGEVRDETTLVMSGDDAATNGTTVYSLKITTTSNANIYNGRFEVCELFFSNDVVGSAITLEVEILHDSVTPLTNADVWMEAQYPGTAGAPLASYVSDMKADILGSAANQDSSSVTWTTTGMSNPNKQKLSVTCTPQEAGTIIVRIFAGKPSYTFYANPDVKVG